MNSSDIAEIQQTAVRFSVGVTVCDTALIASSFAEDGTMTNMSAMLGREDVETVGRAAIKAIFDSFLPHMDLVQQMSQTYVVSVDGSRAEAQTVIREILRAPGGETTVFMATYQDELLKTAEGWRFARRTTKPVATFMPKGVLTCL